MLSLASIDSDASSESSSDEMEVDSVIRDADGVAIGETRRLRPPLANADYSTADSNIRLVKTIGYDPHIVKPQKEALAPSPVSDLYDSISEAKRVTGRITTNLAERVQQNRTGEVPVRPAPDTARPAYMDGMNDTRSVSERTNRPTMSTTSTRRALTETSVNETSGWGTSSVGIAMHAISGAYDKLTKGLRVDKTDSSLKIPNAHEQNRIRLVPSLRKFDPNRGKATAVLVPPPPDATATDKFGIAAHSDHVAFERTSLVLPVAGYGQITIEGEWNNFTPKHDRLEHALIEVDVAEMALHRGELIPCTAHPAHPIGFDGLVRAGLNVSRHQLRFGQAQHTAVGPLQQTGLDGRVRTELDIDPHQRRFGQHAHTAVGPLQPTGLDGLVRAEIDLDPHQRRFGQHTHTAVGPLQQTGLDGRVRTELDIDPHQRRFGQHAHTSVGPLQQTGLDGRVRAELDLDPHHRRFGQHTHTAVGPLQPSGLDANVRVELDVDPHHRRFGQHTHTAVGPLQPTGLDGLVRTELDIDPHQRRFGQHAHTSVGPLQQTGLDGRVRAELDLDPHQRRFGQHTHTAVGPLQQTGLDGMVRSELDLDSHQRRFGQHTHTAVGTLQPTGLDGRVRSELDLDPHQRRFGQQTHTVVGPLPQTGLDGRIRSDLDLDSHQRRFGLHAHTAVGPLQPTGLDGRVRAELDIDPHQRWFGQHTQAAVGHPTEYGSTFDGQGMRKEEQDISIHSREIGQVDGTAHRSQPKNVTDEGRTARISPLNSSDISRDMTLAFAYTGAPRSSVDTDRSAMHRTELSANAPACGMRSATSAAAVQPPVDPGGRVTKRAFYEQNGAGDFAADLSWVAMPHAEEIAAYEPSRVRAPDAVVVRTLPGNHTQNAAHTVAVRDIAKKRANALVNRPPSTAEETVFSKLPIIYESRRRVPMSTEVEPLPPASEFQVEQARISLALPDDEATE